MSIKHIYKGLPESLVTKVLWVDDKYRINELSHQPGGFDIVVEYHSGKVYGYNKIKRPSYYVQKIIINEFENIDEKYYNNLTSSKQLTMAKEIVKSMFARKYEDENEYTLNSFSEVWSSENSTINIFEALTEFENIPNHSQQSEGLSNIDKIFAVAKDYCGVECSKCFILLDAILLLDSNYKNAYLKKLRCIKRTDYKDIIEQSLNLLKIFPNDEDFLVIIGRTFYSLEDYESSYEYYRKAYSINKKNPDALFYLAKFISGIEKSNEIKNPAALAIRLYKRYLIYAIENPMTGHFNLGLLYISQKNYNNAKEQFIKAISFCKKYIDENGPSERLNKHLRIYKIKLSETVEKLRLSEHDLPF